ncbi:hypothetical protein ACS0PU_005677 [Formica fusca]
MQIRGGSCRECKINTFLWHTHRHPRKYLSLRAGDIGCSHKDDVVVGSGGLENRLVQQTRRTSEIVS